MNRSVKNYKSKPASVPVNGKNCRPFRLMWQLLLVSQLSVDCLSSQFVRISFAECRVYPYTQMDRLLNEWAKCAKIFAANALLLRNRRRSLFVRPKKTVYMIYFVAVSWLAAFVSSVMLTPVIRRLAPGLGLVDLPGHRKVHVEPTPMGGGIAVVLGICLPLGCVAILTVATGDQWTNLVLLRDSLRFDSALATQMLAVGIGGLLLFLMGLADDRWNLSWKLRLLVQIAVACGVAAAGVRATLFVSYPWVGFVLTIGWILVLTNAMNFLDNMDGLSAGIGVIAAMMSVAILLLMVREPHYPVTLALLLLGGSLSGFLVWNRPPASIFMGDSGSNLVGFLLATLTICGTFYEQSGSRHVILAPLCVLAVPLYDFVTVILIRLRAGRSPFQGDKSHFSHRLVELGLRPAHAVLTIHLATLMTGLGGILLYQVADWTGALLIAAMIACVLCLISILETVGRRSILSAPDSAMLGTDQNARTVTDMAERANVVQGDTIQSVKNELDAGHTTESTDKNANAVASSEV